MSVAVRIDSELRALGNSEWAKKSQRFFKTGEGGYAATDEFVGIPMPLLRTEVKKRFPLPLKTISDLMPSSCHEVRLFALLMLVRCYERQDNKKAIVSTYLSNLEHVNNWDLVDCSAYKILGPYYLERDKSVLFELAASSSLWKRRVAVITTLHFIKNAHVQTTLELLDLLLEDTEDLIHKANGWMLREIGQVDQTAYRQYLNSRYKKMPRTMLRYAIEKLPAAERKAYREGTVD